MAPSTQVANLTGRLFVPIHTIAQSRVGCCVEFLPASILRLHLSFCFCFTSHTIIIFEGAL